MNKMKQMWLLTAVMMVGVLAAGYFLLISPKKGEVTKIESQTETQHAANVQLQTEIKRLEAQAKTLPAKQARLLEIQKNIPNNPALPALVRALTKSSKRTGMQLEIVEPSAPEFIEQARAAAQPTGTSATSATSSSTPKAASAGKLAIVPLKVTVWGTFAETEEFFHDLERLQRTLMVTSADFTYFTPAEDDQVFGNEGDLKIVIEARVFMRGSSAATPPKAAKAAATTSSEKDE